MGFFFSVNGRLKNNAIIMMMMMMMILCCIKKRIIILMITRFFKSILAPFDKRRATIAIEP